MYKRLILTVLVAVVPWLSWSVGSQEKEKADKRDPEARRAPHAQKPEIRGPRKGSPGITYGPRAAAARVDAPAGAGLRIYSVTSDGKSFTIHGFNKTGFTLALASDDVLVKDRHRVGFHPSVTFADQFANGAKTVGTLSSSGNVWVARGPTYNFDVTSWSRSSRPPVLPKDGQSVTVFPRDFKEGGNEALKLHFPTSRSHGTTFWIVADSVLPAKEKEKPNKTDLLAKETANQFIKGIQGQNLDAVMKTVDVPFYFRGTENFKDRDSLKMKMDFLVKRVRRKVEMKVQSIYSVAEFMDKLNLKDSARKLLRDALDMTDRAVIYTLITDPMVDDRSAVFVRIREGKAKVVGVNKHRDVRARLVQKGGTSHVRSMRQATHPSPRLSSPWARTGSRPFTWGTPII